MLLRMKPSYFEENKNLTLPIVWIEYEVCEILRFGESIIGFDLVKKGNSFMVLKELCTCKVF